MKLFSPIWKSLARKIARQGVLIREESFNKLRKRVEKQEVVLNKYREKLDRVDDSLRGRGNPKGELEKNVLKVLNTLKCQLNRLPDDGLALKTIPKWNTLDDVIRIPESELYRITLEMRVVGFKMEAIPLLEAHVDTSDSPQIIRMLQACFAYESRQDVASVDYLREAIRLTKAKRDTLFWGPVAIVSNAYWSRAMNAMGRKSKTFMWSYANINKRQDFDLLVEDVIPEWADPEAYQEKPGCLGNLPSFLAFMHLVENASVVHIPMTGSFLGGLRIWDEEASLLHEAGIKIVAMPYGGDYYCYSKIQDPNVRYGLLANYPKLALLESTTQKKVDYWQREADCVLAGFMVDAMGRWDVTTFNFFHIDTKQWRAKEQSSGTDGRNGVVKVLHTPNHRGFKGTEFLVEAVEKLKKKGLQVELVLLEKVPNDRVRELMQECDILAEQFIATAYAFSGIEGMASGLPVMANLESEYYTRVYRRYSFLNECPILSTTPETLARNLEILVTQPELRDELGRAGSSYVEKYHSSSAAQYLFGKIYQRILEDKEVDLINLYHPLLSESAKSEAMIEHPLVENRLHEDSKYLQT